MVWQVESYLINQFAGTGNTKAVMQLNKQGGAAGLIVYFNFDNSSPANNTSGPVPIAYMPYATFANMMQMVREEKPIYVQIWPSGITYVGTSQEPVGEDEGP